MKDSFCVGAIQKKIDSSDRDGEPDREGDTNNDLFACYALPYPFGIAAFEDYWCAFGRNFYCLCRPVEDE